jgi:hypothetical protein
MRYAGMLADGTRVEGRELNNWAGWSDSPRLDGIELLNASRPLRWLRDQTLPAFEPGGNMGGLVELSNGDRLPGRVIEYVQPESGEAGAKPGEAGAKPGEPPHLVVAIEAPPTAPSEVRLATRVRVLPRWLRRVVWGRVPPGGIEPGTLLFRDGRRLPYQALRWQRSAVRVLVGQGVQQVPLAELAEIVFPRDDPWQTYCNELAALNLDLKGAARLVRIETAEGLIVTTSEGGVKPAGIGGDRANWYHTARPVWSLDQVWVRLLSIRLRYYFPPHELPLGRWPPVRYVSRPMLSKGWPWRLDSNVSGGLLAGAKQAYGWGLGVHAPCELWFQIPPLADGFRTRAGLDRLAGDGGCVRAVVAVNRSDATPLYRSKHIIGSGEVIDTGTLPLAGPTGGQKDLILVADAAETDRPPGADPLDIRDTLDWIEPVFLLNRDKLRAEVAKRAAARK